MEDRAISLNAVIDALHQSINLFEAEDRIRDLPSVIPCDDAISRQALLDDFGFSEKTRKYGGDHSGYNTMMLYEIQDVIESQPSVKPQPCEDAISRQGDDRWLLHFGQNMAIPSAESKTGHWIMRHREVNTINYRTGEDVLTGEIHTVKELIRYETDEPYCECCGKRAEDISQDYCGYCGAKMFEPQESEDKE